MQLKYGHVLMVVNTFLRLPNSVSEHGNMDRIVIDNVILTRDKQLWEKITYRYLLFNRSFTVQTYISIFTTTWS